MPDDRLIPESMVKLLFDQVKDSADKNTQAIKDFTAVIRELSQIVSQQPSRAEFLAGLEKHDKECERRGGDVFDVIEKEDNVLGTKINGAANKVDEAKNKIEIVTKIIEDDHAILVNRTELLKNIDLGIKELKSSVKTMITVVLVASALLITAFYFVKSASDTSINTAVKEAVREIITSRPSNIYPLPPHEHDKQGNTIFLDEKEKSTK